MAGLWGKYRGTVFDNVDPMGLGRIRANVPEALVDGASVWALPCVPSFGTGHATLLVPSLGTNVWVEFEGGDPERPIWTGIFWGATGEVPPRGIVYEGSAEPEVREVGVGDQAAVIRRPDGGISVQGPRGASIMLDDAGIVIANGLGARIRLQGPIVSINEGALEIT